jgi:hypothetical protein
MRNACTITLNILVLSRLTRRANTVKAHFFGGFALLLLVETGSTLIVTWNTRLSSHVMPLGADFANNILVTTARALLNHATLADRARLTLTIRDVLASITRLADTASRRRACLYFNFFWSTSSAAGSADPHPSFAFECLVRALRALRILRMFNCVQAIFDRVLTGGTNGASSTIAFLEKAAFVAKATDSIAGRIAGFDLDLASTTIGTLHAIILFIEETTIGARAAHDVTRRHTLLLFELSGRACPLARLASLITNFSLEESCRAGRTYARLLTVASLCSIFTCATLGTALVAECLPLTVLIRSLWTWQALV